MGAVAAGALLIGPVGLVLPGADAGLAAGLALPGSSADAMVVAAGDWGAVVGASGSLARTGDVAARLSRAARAEERSPISATTNDDER